jgi:hypothetical protein
MSAVANGPTLLAIQFLCGNRKPFCVQIPRYLNVAHATKCKKRAQVQQLYVKYYGERQTGLRRFRFSADNRKSNWVGYLAAFAARTREIQLEAVCGKFKPCQSLSPSDIGWQTPVQKRCVHCNENCAPGITWFYFYALHLNVRSFDWVNAAPFFQSQTNPSNCGRSDVASARELLLQVGAVVVRCSVVINENRNHRVGGREAFNCNLLGETNVITTIRSRRLRCMSKSTNAVSRTWTSTLVCHLRNIVVTESL